MKSERYSGGSVPSPGQEGAQWAREWLAAGQCMPAGLLALPGARVGPRLGYTAAQWSEFRRGVISVYLEAAECKKKSV